MNFSFSIVVLLSGTQHLLQSLL
ncbi:hypothetical protein Nmel_001556 [Mimus melanotis]